MKRFDWAGAAAFVIALGLSVGFAGALLFAASPATDTISEAGVQLLSTIGGAMVGAVAAYLGVHAERRANGQRTGQAEASEALTTAPVASVSKADLAKSEKPAQIELDEDLGPY